MIISSNEYTPRSYERSRPTVKVIRVEGSQFDYERECFYWNIGLFFFVVLPLAFYIVFICFGTVYISECQRCHRLNDLFQAISENDIFPQVSCQPDSTKHTESVPFAESKYRIICYYVIPSSTTHSRQLPPSFLDPYLCTHVIIGFATVYNGTLAPVPPEILKVYETIVSFKNMNPSMKVLLSVEDFSSEGEFGKMVAAEDLRAKFSVETIKFLNRMNFDGVDLDWEFPAWPAPNKQQTKNFTLLLQNLKKEILAQNNRTYTLSVAVAAPGTIIDQSYEIEEMARYVDFINLMAYDYHMYTQYLPLTGPNAPLYPRPTEQGFIQTMNVNWSATRWHQCGMPISKINIGIPTYGHSFRLVNEDNNGWNAPAQGVGKPGDGGFTTYPDACHFISNPSSINVFDENYLVPYSYNGKDWISYDNRKSVEIKANYIKENKFGGAMIFSLNSDDFYGECGVVKFPLLRQISNILS